MIALDNKQRSTSLLRGEINNSKLSQHNNNGNNSTNSNKLISPSRRLAAIGGLVAGRDGSLPSIPSYNSGGINNMELSGE